MFIITCKEEAQVSHTLLLLLLPSAEPHHSVKYLGQVSLGLSKSDALPNCGLLGTRTDPKICYSV